MSIRRFDEEVMGSPMTWRYTAGEVVELWVEIKLMSWSGIVDESSDVLLCTQLALYHSLGKRVSWPLVLGRRSAEKFSARLAVWHGIFSKEGLRFDKRYLAGGGNYAKPEKVKAALDLARAEQP